MCVQKRSEYECTKYARFIVLLTNYACSSARMAISLRNGTLAYRYYGMSAVEYNTWSNLCEPGMMNTIFSCISSVRHQVCQNWLHFKHEIKHAQLCMQSNDSSRMNQTEALKFKWHYFSHGFSMLFAFFVLWNRYLDLNSFFPEVKIAINFELYKIYMEHDE